jgi:molecular chaperone GrpE (heat shock protein)
MNAPQKKAPAKPVAEAPTVAELLAENEQLRGDLETVRAEFAAYRSREARHDRRSRYRDIVAL